MARQYELCAQADLDEKMLAAYPKQGSMVLWLSSHEQTFPVTRNQDGWE
jgi:hypothetical protein